VRGGGAPRWGLGGVGAAASKAEGRTGVGQIRGGWAWRVVVGHAAPLCRTAFACIDAAQAWTRPHAQTRLTHCRHSPTGKGQTRSRRRGRVTRCAGQAKLAGRQQQGSSGGGGGGGAAGRLRGRRQQEAAAAARQGGRPSGGQAAGRH
jgi:hypothetical protein